MVDVDKAVIARIKKNGENFEILVDCDKAIEFKEGKFNMEDILATNCIFRDVNKGEKASENLLVKIFGSSDVKKVAEHIIKNGDIQLTVEHRKKIREDKKKSIINIIHKNGIDPRTRLPHPPDRIERAIEQAGVHINEFKKAEEQIQDILTKIRPILPISLEKKEIWIKIPAKFASQCCGIVKRLCTIKSENWGNNGDLVCTIEIAGGLQEELFDKLNKISHGEIESKEIK